MIHQYKNNGYNIILDVESGAVHVVDEPMYDLAAVCDRMLRTAGAEAAAAAFIEEKKQDIISETLRLHPTLSREGLEEIYDELLSLVRDESLFSRGDYEDRVKAFLVGKRMAGHTTVKAMCLHVAHDCNLACKYCFAGGGEYNGGRRMLMSYETGRAALDFLVANSANRRNLEVDFFGGEPLMNFEVVKRLVAYGRSIEELHDKRFRFTLTTNGILLSDEIMDFLNEEMDNVVLSIDGRREVNDLMRPYLDRRNMRPSDKGSYDVIVEKFRRFKEKRKGTYYVRGTFTSKNLDFSRDVMHLRELGFDAVSVEPVVAKETDDYALSMKDLPVLFDEYDRLAKEMADIAGTEDDFTFFHFMIDLEGGPCVYKRLSGCGSGTEYLAVTPDGELYPCHQFVGNRDFLMGDVFSGIRRDDLVDEFSGCNVYSKPKCRDCFAKYYCSGGCAANSYSFHGSITEPYELGCELQKKRIECAIMLKAAEAEL